jgi:thiamine-phosphate pyrophosphorylase
LQPIFPTLTKTIARAPQGLDRIAAWKSRLGAIALIAIGGISLERAPAVFAAGADVAAAVSDVTLAARPEERARAWVEATRALATQALTAITPR